VITAFLTRSSPGHGYLPESTLEAAGQLGLEKVLLMFQRIASIKVFFAAFRGTAVVVKVAKKGSIFRLKNELEMLKLLKKVNSDHVPRLVEEYNSGEWFGVITTPMGNPLTMVGSGTHMSTIRGFDLSLYSFLLSLKGLLAGGLRSWTARCSRFTPN